MLRPVPSFVLCGGPRWCRSEKTRDKITDFSCIASHRPTGKENGECISKASQSSERFSTFSVFFLVFEERFSPRQGFLFEIILYEEQRMFRLVDIKSQVATGKYAGTAYLNGAWNWRNSVCFKLK